MRYFKTLGIVLLCGLASAGVSAAERIEATYNFIWNGLVVFTAETVVERDTVSYAVQMDVRTRGLMRLFSKGQGHMVAEGTLGPDGSYTARRFLSEGRWSGDDYRKEIFFLEDGSFSHWERDWPEEWLEDIEREPVPEDMMRGPDGLSTVMAFMLGQSVLENVEEPLKHRVFEGDHVTEVGIICAVDDGSIKESRHSPMSGAARKCWFDSKTIAGEVIETEKLKEKRLREEEKARKKAERYRKRHQNDDDEDDEEGENDPDGLPIWFQEVKELGFALPVRAGFNTGWGKVRMYLKELKTSDGLHLEP